ncbi:MFS transporter [Kineococcus sp. R8]|uniref:MFS transporter n=1 Tax=Kineococcus siccus TaxID=2696567 RepID=UPI0014123236|nr:MFS transporter [Kineococcus siccus]
MSSVVDALVPARLGRSFRWLLASSWLSNLGDGIALAAGPLLVASMTDDPFVVALAALVQWLPPLLLALPAGVLSDRVDRRRLMVVVDLLRAAVLVVLTLSVASGAVPVAVVLLALFAAASAEVFEDNTAATLLPSIVARDDLAVANVRLLTGFVTVNQLVGPPLGAFLFTLGSFVPFGAQAALVAFSAVTVSRVVLARRAGPRPASRVRSDLAEGFRWVFHHAAVRVLVLTIFTFNLTWGAAWSVLVLYATQRLGLGPVGYGWIATVSAAGGIVGTLAYGRITRRVSLGDLLRVGLVVETLTHLALALTTSPAVAFAVFFVFGVHAFVWGTTSLTVRQRAVPEALQGRVGAVNSVGTYGGLVIGSGVGGLLAQHLGVTAPFFYAFAGSAVFLVLLWPQLRHVAHADARAEPLP